MTYRRATGLLAALSLIARFIIVDSSWGDSIVCGALAISAGVALTLAFRAGRVSAAELVFTWLSVIGYAAGGVYLDHWSGEGDIGGVVPGLLGFIGMLTIAVAMNLPASRHSHAKS